MRRADPLPGVAPRVYVAASSDELERASVAMDRVRDEGWVVTFDWVKAIVRVGSANPVDATRTQRAGWAYEDVEGVRTADALWMLAPRIGAGRGAFFELGLAYALGIPTVVSGPTRCSIFAALAQEVEDDDSAVALLRGWLG